MNWRQASADRIAVDKNRASAAVAGVATDLHIARSKPLAKRFGQSFAGRGRQDDGSSIEPESKFLLRTLQLAVPLCQRGRDTSPAQFRGGGKTIFRASPDIADRRQIRKILR